MTAMNRIDLNDPTPESDLQRAEEAIAAITEKFDQEYALLDILEKDGDDITQDKAELAALQDALDDLAKQGVKVDTDISHYKNGADLCHQVKQAIDAKWPKSWNVPNQVAVDFNILARAQTPPDVKVPTKEDAALQDLYKLQKEVNKAEEDLANIDPGIQDLINEINALMNSLAHGKISSTFLKQDLATLDQYFAPLFKAMTEKLHADEDRELIKAGGDGALTDAQLEALYLDLAHNCLQEQSTLFNLEDKMTQDISDWRDVENKAKEDKDKINAWTNLKSGDIWGNKKEYLKEVQKNASLIQSAIRNLVLDLSPEIGSISSQGMLTLEMMLDMIMREVEKAFANHDLTPKEQKEAILNCFAMVLSLLSAIQTTVASDRAEFDKRVAAAMQKASLFSIQDSISQQKEIDNLKHSANQMKKVLFGVKVAMTALMLVLTIATGGAAAALAVGVLGGLDLSGGIKNRSVLDKGQEKLAVLIQNAIQKSSSDDKNHPSKGAKIAAEIIMGLSEAAFVGGAAAASSGAKTAAADAAIEAAETALKDTIEMIAVEEVERAMNLIAEKMAEEELQVTVQDAAQALNKQAEETAAASLKKTAEMLVKRGSWSDMIQFGKETYKPAYELAMKTAQVTAKAVQESEVLAQMALKGSLDSEMGKQEAQKIIDKAVADTMKLTEKELAKASSRSISETIVEQTAWTSLYTLANNNVLVDSIEQLMKQLGMKDDDKTFETIQAIITVVQALMAMLGMMMMANASQLPGSSLPVWASRAAYASQIAAAGTSTYAEASIAMTTEQQAKIIPKVAKDNALIDAFHLLMQQQSQSQKKDQDRYNDQAEQSYKSGAELIHKGLVNNDDIWRVLATAV